MSFLRPLRRTPALQAWLPARRCYTTPSSPAQASSSEPDATAAQKSETQSRRFAASTRSSLLTVTSVAAKSSCPEGTVLTGLNYLKGQGEVVAQPDSAYPDWLWELVGPKRVTDDGPGGKEEKIALRKENRARIREQNFMKSQ
ncbi:mitochondrial/chloroplast ribosomal protein L54/L37 [Rhodofomes roseus]|uniref:Large ribosomal subunit protein mL54 n=1 Tax=Rhodofomes roseus TaxID=34475 RepID=A0ABQ8K897_9APHY|nr:mitochondrial/chloroplast ribosomal protein L54/L37 [Rhodofomes roseus]KAH9833070.1 mitochondrial/chloroplast ribosomal protein L54/L37 [Rhodofomes roseus]